MDHNDPQAFWRLVPDELGYNYDSALFGHNPPLSPEPRKLRLEPELLSFGAPVHPSRKPHFRIQDLAKDPNGTRPLIVISVVGQFKTMVACAGSRRRYGPIPSCRPGLLAIEVANDVHNEPPWCAKDRIMPISPAPLVEK